jgi:hypothetical protein
MHKPTNQYRVPSRGYNYGTPCLNWGIRGGSTGQWGVWNTGSWLTRSDATWHSQPAAPLPAKQCPPGWTCNRGTCRVGKEWLAWQCG